MFSLYTVFSGIKFVEKFFFFKDKTWESEKVVKEIFPTSLLYLS
jgi:hypothetical protein